MKNGVAHKTIASRTCGKDVKYKTDSTGIISTFCREETICESSELSSHTGKSVY